MFKTIIVGQTQAESAIAQAIDSYATFLQTPLGGLYRAASVATGAAGAYHGYRRSGGKVRWAIGYGMLGSLAPLITGPIMLAQGFGKRK